MKKSLFGIKSGFTIIELMISIVIIGILATIVIVSYNGVSQKAIVASLQSDLFNAAEQLKIYKIQNNGSYPANYAFDCGATPAANTICFKASSGNTIPTLLTNNSTNPKTFCVRAHNSRGLDYIVTESTQPAAGLCPPFLSAPVTYSTPGAYTVSIPSGLPSDATNAYAVEVKTYGAQGGSAYYPGGGGGYSAGTISIASGNSIYIYVGGQNGYNGGGNGSGAGSNGSCDGGFSAGANGGGASDVRYGGNTITPTDYRKIVAGGGGGGSGYNDGCGYDGSNGGSGGGSGGGGAAGSTGSNGAAGRYGDGGGSGGGGGGWRGGYGGSNCWDSPCSGGGGGSGYIGGANAGTGSYSNGGNTGDGKVILTYESPS